ncbi:MAG: hypothetical protein H0X60_01955 [Chloroflexi bacterium]|nr:hypothetical protein [Chloroflexota bacterium]
MRVIGGIGVMVAVALALVGCSLVAAPDPDCPPVDEGGECFVPTEQGFLDHALESAGAWPQLDGISLVPQGVIEGFDEAANQPTWIVPMVADGSVVAASRFLALDDRVRLGEVVLYQPPRPSFPTPGDGERLVISPALGEECVDPVPDDCLFAEHLWRLEPAP